MDEARLVRLENAVRKLERLAASKKKQQISFPVDQQSRKILGIPDVFPEIPGLGSTPLTQNINLSGAPETIAVPAAYYDTIFVDYNGIRYEVPIIAAPI